MLILSAVGLLAGTLLTLAVVAVTARSTRPAKPVVVGGPRSHRRRAARVPIVAEIVGNPATQPITISTAPEVPTGPAPAAPKPAEPPADPTGTGEFRIVADAVIAARDTARRLSIR